MKILFAGKPVQQLVIELYGNAIKLDTQSESFYTKTFSLCQKFFHQLCFPFLSGARRSPFQTTLGTTSATELTN